MQSILQKIKNQKISVKLLLILLTASALYIGMLMANTIGYDTKVISSGSTAKYVSLTFGWGTKLIIASSILLLVSTASIEIFNHLENNHFDYKKVSIPLFAFGSSLLLIIGIFISGFAVRSNYFPSWGGYKEIITRSTFAFNALDVTYWSDKYLMNGVGVFAGYALALLALIILSVSLLVRKEKLSKIILSIVLQTTGLALYVTGALLQCKNLSVEYPVVDIYGHVLPTKIEAKLSSSAIIFIILAVLSIASLVASIIVQKTNKDEYIE